MEITRYDARSILTPTGGFLRARPAGGRESPGCSTVIHSTGYTHTLNPAIGCPYAAGLCGMYCYAQWFATTLLGSAEAWGQKVRVKRNAAALLERELQRACRRDPGHPHHIERLAIFASSSTDPCAGPAREVFRDCLRVLQAHPIRRVVVQTRSPGLLSLREEIEALGPRAAISFTLETDDDRLWQRGPRGAPGIARRRAIFETLGDWSVLKHLAVSPCLPVADVSGFADWIAAHADRATVDTFTAGDGSPAGARTARTPLPAFLHEQGRSWRSEDQPRALYEALRQRIGERAGWSSEGFNRLADPSTGG